MFNPEHLSFSGTLRRSDGSVMIIRHTSATVIVPVWEHPFSGSPREAETLTAAVRRCAERDLGVISRTVEALLPTLGKRAGSSAGNIEIHPSYVVTSEDDPVITGDCEILWLGPLELGTKARQSPSEYSALLALHAAQLPFYGGSSRSVHPVTPHEERATG